MSGTDGAAARLAVGVALVIVCVTHRETAAVTGTETGLATATAGIAAQVGAASSRIGLLRGGAPCPTAMTTSCVVVVVLAVCLSPPCLIFLPLEGLLETNEHRSVLTRVLSPGLFPSWKVGNDGKLLIQTEILLCSHTSEGVDE